MLLDRILVPLDGSPLGESVLHRGMDLFKRGRSELVLTRVAVAPEMPDVKATTIHPIDTLEREARSYLEQKVEALSREGVHARAITERGNAAEAILAVARAEEVSLIAMSSHGRTGLTRWIFGSIAQKVLRASSIPVLVVRAFYRNGRGMAGPLGDQRVRIDKIFVPLDGSDLAAGVLPAVADLAGSLGARVVLVLVLHPALKAETPVPGVSRAEQWLRDRGIAVEIVVKTGDVAPVLLDVCDEGEASMIAMATHGRSGAPRWVMGSITEKVLQASDAPILIVRSPLAESEFAH